MILTLCFVLLTANLLIGKICNVEISVFAATGEDLRINMENVKDKFEPWLFDKIQNLTSTDLARKITLVVCLENADGNSKEVDETIYAALFSKEYDAEIMYVADKLGIIIIKTSVENALDIATRDYVSKLGDGKQSLEPCLNVSARAIRARPDVWNLSYKGDGIKIAIIDHGIDTTHPDLDDIDDIPSTNDPKVILEHDFTGEGITTDTDPFGHGTSVAGVAAGTGYVSKENLSDNSWFIGVAPKAFLFNYRVFNSSGYANTEWVIQAINWAVSNGSDIINISGGISANGDGTHPISIAADNAVENGVVVVVAANDHPVDGDFPIGIPGDAFNVITVGSIDDNETVNISDDNRSFFRVMGLRSMEE